MPDVQEVFRMATQKVGPDPGALERQHRNQRQRRTRRKAGVYGLVAALVIIAIVIVINVLPGNGGPTLGTTPTPSSSTGIFSASGLYAVNVDTGAPTLLFETPDGASEFALAPNGDLVAFLAEDADGHPQIFVSNVDGSDLHQVSHEPFAAESPAWSPDGTRIAFRGLASDTSYEIFVLDVASGESNRITREAQDLQTGYTDQPSWMPDGRAIVFQSGASAAVLRIVDVATGKTTTIVENAGIPDVSPDGSKVAFNTWSVSKVTIADIDGSHRTMLQNVVDDCCAKWSPDGGRIVLIDIAGNLFVYDVTTEERRAVGSSSPLSKVVDWLDDQTVLILYN